MSKFGAYLSKPDLIRIGMDGLGCGCRRGMADLGCDGCAGDCQGKGFGDLGLDPSDPLSQIPALKPIQAQMEMASALVSPWLWVFSVVGFGLAMLNTKRVDAMWGRFGGSKFKGLTKPKL
jgi:hypothetical protein